MNPLVVIGDAMLDIDLEGTADRLCPEAPVPVVDVEREWRRPGGAGLAALLAARSTSAVALVTAIGDDTAGHVLTELLGRDLEVVPLPLRGGTVCKTRVRALGQSMVRLDSGDGVAGAEPLPAGVAALVRSAGAILVADYGRGVARHPGIRDLLAEVAHRIPVVWDPHPRGPVPVEGIRLATPNEAEAKHFAPGYSGAAELARILRDNWSAANVTVTAGAEGAILADGENCVAVPVPRASAISRGASADTCGAGDRFASAAAAALLDGASVPDAVAAAVDAAARFVAAGGACALSTGDSDTLPAQARPSQTGSAFDLAARVRERGGRLVATGGCFDLLHPGHLSLLREARALGDALVVCLNSDSSVRRLKGPSRPIVGERDRARLLAELSSVDAVAVFEEDFPISVLGRLRPDVWVKGGDYRIAELPETPVVRQHGGEIVLIPTVHGYSTTKLVAAAHAGH
ncbi:MAG: D-beta-D-heptose 7-phosphate kinase / D-beta-D-heptose 1-phosphate adenosyltransferase [Actinomycetota bacterium]|jgi:rfaE bifunctional protein nucleotidyltransferase chain/domain/rfaE bifunctional protein kinase chain/domain|nr:D-beta-D-heptose 7-phosphate kinase / D-beta-D-heptose 1-phosphate adenosyltransferase [Actinomycetota bacterium]